MNRKCTQLLHPLQPLLNRPAGNEIKLYESNAPKKPLSLHRIKSVSTGVRSTTSTVGYAVSNRTIDDAIEYTQNKKIELRKQLDLLRYRFKKAQVEFEACLKKQHELRQKLEKYPESETRKSKSARRSCKLKCGNSLLDDLAEIRKKEVNYGSKCL